MDELHNVASFAATTPNGWTSGSVSVHEGSNSLPIGSVVPKFSLRYGFRRRVWLVHGELLALRGSYEVSHQGGINPNAGQPACKLGESRRRLVSYDVRKALSEGSSPSSLGGCDQLLLAPRSKIANCCGIALRQKKSTHHYGEPPSRKSGPVRGSQHLFPFPSTRGRRTVLQLHPNRLAIS